MTIDRLWEKVGPSFVRFFNICHVKVEKNLKHLGPLHRVYKYISLVLRDGKEEITDIYYCVKSSEITSSSTATGAMDWDVHGDGDDDDDDDSDAAASGSGGAADSGSGGGSVSGMDVDIHRGGKKKYKGGGDPIGYYLSTETEKENEGFVLKPIYDQATLDRMKQRFHENMLINIYHEKIEEEIKRNRVTVRPNPITPDIVKKVPSIPSPIISRTPPRRQQSLPLRTAGGFAKKQTKRNQKNKRTKKYRNKNPRRKTRRIG
jgi:hypothetical protein